MVRLSDIPFEVAARVEDAVRSGGPRLETREIGRVRRVLHGVVDVEGLSHVGSNEVVHLAGETAGLATGLREGSAGVVLLGSSRHVRPGDAVYRTHRALAVPVGPGLLGRVIDPMGRPLDAGGALQASAHRPVWSPAPAILDRAPVSRPLQTGIKAVDATIPVGKGQRELILGDRQTGKTAIAVGAMINQRHSNVIAIYCAIGQRATATARVVHTLRRAGVFGNAIVMATSGESAAGLQYIAPYAAMAVAESFMHQGRDVVVVFDDLTRHARAYRELSLLLRRPPGREAYPGDIFHVHAKLLERATQLRAELGGGSITALPIVETQAGNIAAYIPTNLISITDGQIYLSPRLFQLGVLPAIDIGHSVSRVGGKAQRPEFRSVVQQLKLAYAQFEELESFARFGTRLDEATRSKIARGRRVREILKQDEHDAIPVPEQVAVLLAVTEGVFDEIPVEDLAGAENAIRIAVRERADDVRGLLDELAGPSRAEAREALLDIARSAVRRSGFRAKA